MIGIVSGDTGGEGGVLAIFGVLKREGLDLRPVANLAVLALGASLVLARIAILIPPPRYPLQRFAGVLAPHSSWRRAVVAMRPPRSSHGPASRPGHRPR